MMKFDKFVKNKKTIQNPKMKSWNKIQFIGKI